METAKPPVYLTNDFDARLEKRLEQLKEVPIDTSWLEEVLPEGFTITETSPHGQSFHARTGSILGTLKTGEVRKYFLKLGVGDLGRRMLQGEFESMKALHAISPDFVPYPLGYGTYQSDLNTHFFICDFIDMAIRLPEKSVFCSKLADLHHRSQQMPQYGLESSPLGVDGKGEANTIGIGRKFGFPITTYNAKLPQDNTWSPSWESFYLTQMRQLFDLERKVHGGDPDLEALLPSFYGNVIPRLLRPLETGGNTLIPALIHGDLWHSNAAVRNISSRPGQTTPETEQSFIFDASAFYAHNEAELGMWRPRRFEMRSEYVKQYFRYFPASSPAEDWDDRNLLYSLRPDLQDSTLFPSTTRFRELVIETLRHLVEKYKGGYEEWHQR